MIYVNFTEENNKFYFILPDGYKVEPKLNDIKGLLFNFTEVRKYTYEGKHLKYGMEPVNKGNINTNIAELHVNRFTDEIYLTIRRPEIIYEILKEDFISEYLTVKEYAALVNKSEAQIKKLCQKDALLGAYKLGRDWIIPKKCPYPEKKNKKKNINNRYTKIKNK